MIVNNEEMPKLAYIVTSLKGDARNQATFLFLLPINVLLVEDISTYLNAQIMELQVDKVYELFSTFL